MINRQLRPLSLTIWSPRNSANLFAVLIDVDFCPSYSSSFLDMLRFSQINSKSSLSGMFVAWNRKRKVNLRSEYNKPSFTDPGTKKLPWRGGCRGVGFKESQRRQLMYCRNHATLYECSIQGVRLTEESVMRVECNKQFGTHVVHPCLSPATFLFCETEIVDSARRPSKRKRS